MAANGGVIHSQKGSQDHFYHEEMEDTMNHENQKMTLANS